MPRTASIGLTFWSLVATASLLLVSMASVQLGDSSFEQLDHPAIEYSTRPARDPVALLSARIQSVGVKLTFDDRHGYLRSLLSALDIPIESQVAVFSKTSTQFNLIQPRRRHRRNSIR